METAQIKNKDSIDSDSSISTTTADATSPVATSTTSTLDEEKKAPLLISSTITPTTTTVEATITTTTTAAKNEKVHKQLVNIEKDQSREIENDNNDKDNIGVQKINGVANNNYDKLSEQDPLLSGSSESEPSIPKQISVNPDGSHLGINLDDKSERGEQQGNRTGPVLMAAPTPPVMVKKYTNQKQSDDSIDDSQLPDSDDDDDSSYDDSDSDSSDDDSSSSESVEEPKNVFDPITGQMMSGTEATSAILDLIQNNDDTFDTLELTDEVVGCSLSDLMQASASNKTVRHVFINERFISSMKFEKSLVMFEVLGSLPNLETFSIEFPISGGKYFNKKRSLVPLICNAIPKKTSNLRSLSLYNLKLLEPGDETILSEVFTKTPKLSKIDLIDFTVSNAILNNNKKNNSSGLKELFAIFRDKLPCLEEVEIRMKNKQALPYCELMCSSQSIKWLNYWKIIFTKKQAAAICRYLNYNKSMIRFELWCSDFVLHNDDTNNENIDQDNFGTTLSNIIRGNQCELEAIIISHIHMSGEACISILHAMKYNTFIKDLALINVDADHDDDPATTTTILGSSKTDYNNDNDNNTDSTKNTGKTDNNDGDINIHSEISPSSTYRNFKRRSTISQITNAITLMMMNKKDLQSLTVTYDELDEEGCKECALNLQSNTSLRNLKNQGMYLDVMGAFASAGPVPPPPSTYSGEGSEFGEFDTSSRWGEYSSRSLTMNSRRGGSKNNATTIDDAEGQEGDGGGGRRRFRFRGRGRGSGDDNEEGDGKNCVIQ